MDQVQPYNPSSAFGAWQLMKNDQGQWMLYNIGAKQYARTPSSQSGTGPCTFVDEALPINVTELPNGGFAFNTGCNAQQFFCAAPQLADSPINVWTLQPQGATHTDRQAASTPCWNIHHRRQKGGGEVKGMQKITVVGVI